MGVLEQILFSRALVSRCFTDIKKKKKKLGKILIKQDERGLLDFTAGLISAYNMLIFIVCL